MNKYGAIRTEVDGHKFDSRAEARRYGELVLMQRAGEISDLELQPSYDLVVNGRKVARYVADFRYRTVPGGQTIIEDVKGGKATRTPIYRLKARLMDACHGIRVVEVDA